jgi:hypothetical protein
MPNTAGTTERKLHPPFTQPDPGRRAAEEPPGESARDAAEVRVEPKTAAGGLIEVDVSALPPIEDFVDDLPSIQDFLMVTPTPAQPQSVVASQPVYAAQPQPQAPAAVLETDAEGWASADWQSYDWSGLATLAAPPPEAAEAHHAWSSTNWDASGRRQPQTGAGTGRELGDDVADALDEMARRIRSGEISLEQFRGVPPEAAVAAAFAALVRAKG